MYEAHPYQPFPTEALEAAVAAVPLSAYPSRERRLAQFGREFVYSRAPAGGTAGAGSAAGSDAYGEGGGGGGGGGERRRAWAGAGAGAGRRQREVVAAAAPSGASLDSLASTDEPSAAESASDGEGAEVAAVGAAAGQAPRRPRWAPMQPWVRDALAFVASYPRLADPVLIRRANVTVQRTVLPLRPYMQPPRAQRLPDGSLARPSALLAESGLAAAVGPARQQGTGLLGRGSRAGRRGALAHPQLPLQRSPLHTCGLSGSLARPAAVPRVQLMLAGRGLLRLLRVL